MSGRRSPHRKPDATPAHLVNDTIAAIATAPGRSAVAVVRVSGHAAFDIAARCIEPWPLRARHATLVRVRHPSGAHVDQALSTAFPAPRSFSGEDMLEISSHGGVVAPSLVLEALVTAGARPALPGEFTRRAVLNGKIDLLRAEALGELIEAPTRILHRAALDQLSGTLARRIEALRASMIGLEALLAYDIDFPGEDDGPIPRARVAAALHDAQGEIATLLDTLPAARLAREGAVVVLAGVPNSGKSSLFNAMLGEARAIVTEFAGTTRDAIDALVDAEPYPWRLIDTAGLRSASDPVERLGVEVSERWLARADLVLICGTDAATRRTTLQTVRSLAPDAAVISVQTMSDLPGSPSGEDAVRVSTLTGDGLAALRAAVAAALAARCPAPSDVPMLLRARHVSALDQAREELSLFDALWESDAVPPTIAAVHVRAAVHALDDLIGAVDVQDVLDRVFASFCVGK